jgi:formamidopyrimidine-DNA glycosylase
VPELPEVELVRRALEPVLAGARFTSVLLRRKNLRIPFPRRFAARLTGQTVTGLTRRAKYLLATLSSGETLLIHLGMTGGFRVETARVSGGYRSDELTDDEKHDHVVFTMSSGAVVTFNDARRFGLMDLVARGGLDGHPVVGRLGPEPLSIDFNGAALARACHRKSVPLKVALLDQRVVAGVGNIYASEALWIARLSPTRKAATIATPTGLPRAAAARLAAAVTEVLHAAIAGTGPRFRVYERDGGPCLREDCGGTIRRIVQAARSTFYCPRCQR